MTWNDCSRYWIDVSSFRVATIIDVDSDEAVAKDDSDSVRLSVFDRGSRLSE
jgi:hypothetical protein